MQTDLTEIKKIAMDKENENWEFRIFLKDYDTDNGNLDSIVHNLYDEVSSKIDCTQCANCCKQVKPILSTKDIDDLLKGPGLSREQLEAQLIKKGKNGICSFIQLPCPLLKDNLCTRYNFRPHACRSFPHIDKEGFSYRLIEVVNNYSICPIVFNVYEKLKGYFLPEYGSITNFPLI